MPWREDMAIDLPDGDGGSDDGRDPDALRNDILDELADHLDCAMQREFRTTDDEHEARTRVLQRFGNPAPIARRLWLDAMKGRLMAMKISIGINVLLALVIVAVILMMTNEIARSRDITQMIMAEMQQTREALERAEANQASAASDWATLEITVVDPQTGQTQPGLEAVLRGKFFNENETESIKIVTDSNGKAVFGPIKPGSHSLRVSSPHGHGTSEYVTVLPKKNQSYEFKWLPLEFGSKPVELSFGASGDHIGLRPTPESGVTANFAMTDVEYIECRFEPQYRDDEDRVWTWPGIELLVNREGLVVESSNRESFIGLEGSDLWNALAALPYSESVQLPAGRSYRLTSMLAFVNPGKAGENQYVGASRVFTMFEIPEEPASTTNWHVKIATDQDWHGFPERND